MRRLLALALVACGVSTAQGPAPIFRFETGEFWLNLHHFLYVLGRAGAKLPDARREAVAGAPAESRLTSDPAWTEAVTAYANGLSRKEAVFDESMATLTAALAGGTVPADVRGVLERAAPVYRETWWPEHRAGNEAWVASTQKLLDRHGRAVLDFITAKYGMKWPANGYPVHVSAYATWAGAYSTAGGLLVVASNPGAGTRGLDGLETVFHEAMHQWDDEMRALLERLAAGKHVSRNLSHTLIFYTAGYAVHRVAPEHIPYADAHGVWERGWTRLQAALDKTWKPYLDGHGTRDEALAAAIDAAAGIP